MILEFYFQSCPMSEVFAIGLMSGTSLDGVDGVLLRTDGSVGNQPHMQLCHVYMPYPQTLQTSLRTLCQENNEMSGFQILTIEKEITRIHAQVVQQILEKSQKDKKEIEVIGFHGQTILHRPQDGITWQIGDGALLSELTGIFVVNNFRVRDMAAGGQGAPVLPVYHAALAGHLLKNLATQTHASLAESLQGSSLCILNLGGVANVTHIAFPENEGEARLVAFDTGPGNALMNDWMNAHTNQPYDQNGEVARGGQLLEPLLAEWTGAGEVSRYLKEQPPKSLDRNTFASVLQHLDQAEATTADGCRTLLEMSIACIQQCRTLLDPPPAVWLVTGGGRKNEFFMERLKESLSPAVVYPVEAVGWDGDMLEAEGMAFLAVRCLRKLPLTFPTTTACREPVTGGTIHFHSERLET